MPGTPAHRLGGPEAAWARLRAAARATQPAGLLPPGPGRCRTCHGPAQAACARCFPCRLHAESAPGLLADVVVPVGYAVKGSGFAQALWRYKSGLDGARAAQSALRALLLVFLHDHGSCVWRSAGLPPPSHVSVVPSGRGRPGPHPLAGLVTPFLARPGAVLARAGPADPGRRDLDPARFRAVQPLPGATVLLLDDTWTSGSAAQSAALALRAAGARHVAVVVLGRHLSLADLAAPGSQRPAAGRPRPFQPGRCAVHAG